MVRAIGVDLGSKRIGVAVSAGTLATPLEVVERRGAKAADHAAIAELVAEAEAEVVVVGLPLSMDGSVGRAAQRALDEVDVLRSALDVPVETWDERLSTVTAEQSLQAQQLNGPARRRVIDKVAAAVILQAWIDAQPDRAQEQR
ncbi:MAG: Holliday junction resolvase RuvX [Acidimicrobiales bacterium]|nr:Holliday junction resolvase RuvX [Acidimicrobiales bacterium]